MKAPIFARKRLIVALFCYAILAVIAILALEGILRWGVLSLFAILFVKTLIHAQQDEGMD